MHTPSTGWRENARIVWAITTKDLLEAVKNRNTLTVLITSLFMVLFYRMMPVLFEGDEPLNVLAYDAGRSTLIAYLENSQNLNLYTYPSEEALLRYLAEGDVPELGLVIPADFDRALASGEALALQGYLMAWVGQQDAAELTQTVEAEIAALVGRPVTIQTEGNAVYPRPDSGGIGVQAGFSIMFVLLMVGLSLVGHLFLEEKQSRTLDSLLVSPAGAAHVVLAKALTGLFYGLLGAGVALAINRDIIVHWGLAVTAVLVTSLFTVSLGLLLGSGIENRGQLTLWAWVILTPLLIPIFLSLVGDLVPPAVIRVTRLIPSVTAFDLLRISFANPIPLGTALLQCAWILAWAVALLAATAWVVRRQESGAGPIWAWGRTGRAQQQEPVPVGPDQRRRLPALIETLGSFARADRRADEAAGPAAGLASMEDAQRSARSTGQGLRIVWAIATKDVCEAVHNKIFLSVLLGVGVMIASNAAIPLLLQQRARPRVILYDEGRSAIVRSLTGGDEFQIGWVDSWEALEAAVSEAPVMAVGLVIPADFDQRAGGSEAIQLAGFVAHWTDPDEASAWAQRFEGQLEVAAWAPVQIEIGARRLYPGPEAGGNPLMVISLLSVVILTLGASLVPLLLVEEKESHTLEAVLISPAGFGQLVAGKALAGSTFCLLAALVVMAFSLHLFVHGWVALLAVVLGAAFAVAVGLLIGSAADNPATTGMWGALILVALIGLTALQFLDRVAWPPLLQSLLAWLPGAHLIRLFRFSMAESFPQAQLLTSLAVLAVGAGALYVLAGLLMRRVQR